MSNAKISFSAPLDPSNNPIFSIPASTTYTSTSPSSLNPTSTPAISHFQIPTLTPKGIEEIDQILHDEYARGNLPGVFLGAVNANEVIYLNQEGKVDWEEEEGENMRMIDEDTIIHIFSMTKFITSLSALQLVYPSDSTFKPLITLDEPVDHILPELALDKLRILKGYKDSGEEIWEEVKERITLRMLLTHTAGMAYGFTSPDLARWTSENKPPPFEPPTSPPGVEKYIQPLVYQPGTSWKYSISLDWAGILIERLSGLSLEEYFKKNIFERCGMDSTTFYPHDWVKDRLMKVCIRTQGDCEVAEQGKGKGKGGGDRRLETVKGSVMGKPQDPELVGQLGGGGGLYGTVKDYLRLIHKILESHPSNPTPPAKPFLSKEIFEEIFTGSLPSSDGNNTSLSSLASFMCSESFPKPDPTASTVQHSCGLSINLVDSTWGRKAGSGGWAGAAKSQFWIDPVTCVGGVLATQLFAPNPDEWTHTYNRFERTLYSNLEVKEGK